MACIIEKINTLEIRQLNILKLKEQGPNMTDCPKQKEMRDYKNTVYNNR